MTSSVEIFETEHLTHIESHSFGIAYGSCTWIDRYGGYWVGNFRATTTKKADTKIKTIAGQRW